MTTSSKENEKPRKKQPDGLPRKSEVLKGRIPSPIPAEILEKLPPEVREAFSPGNVQITEIAASMAMYRGPWPPSSILAEYEKDFPGWGVRLLELTEQQVAHRQALESKQVERSELRMDIGQKFGFATAALSIVVAGGLLVLAPTHWSVSFAALGIAIVGVGGPTVARLLATKFKWPSAPDTPSKKNEKTE